MYKIASIGLAIGALTVAVLPVRADDQTIGFATAQFGGAARPAQTDYRQVWAISGQHRSSPQVSPGAYAGFAQDGAYMQTCSHVGGPKGDSWTCR
jgi:hypothetical protein